MAEDVGGFFARLSLKTDKESFDRGSGALVEILGGLKGLLGTAAGMAGITASLKGMYDAASKMGQLMITGDYLGMSADAITAWSGAVNEAGGSAEGFVNSVKTMHRNLVDLYALGKENDPMFTNLALLLGKTRSVDQFMKESTNQQVWDLMQAARTSKDPQKAYTYLLNLLGPDALKTIQYSRLTGKTLPQMYGEAGARDYATDRTRMGALAGTGEVRNLFDNMTGIWDAFSALAMSDAGPRIKKLNEWLRANHENISKGIDVAVGVGELLIDLTNFALLKGGVKGLKEWKRPDATVLDPKWWGAEAGNVGNLLKDMFQPAYEDIAKLISKTGIKIDLSDEAKKLLKAIPQAMGGAAGDAAEKAMQAGTR